VDPAEQLVSIDASLVDSHALGAFAVQGDAALRFNWSSHGYFVASIGGFYPGFNPEPARVPFLRRLGLSTDHPFPGIRIGGEGYFAITSNTLQLGGRLEITFSAGIEAHGFVQVDALVQFRPFRFEAEISAGFSGEIEGFTFASITLSGAISGPGPIVVRGRLRVKVFGVGIPWSQTFTLGSGPGDDARETRPLLPIIAEALRDPLNTRSGRTSDPLVVLRPDAPPDKRAAIPPTGSLRVTQSRAPLNVKVDRVAGVPLGAMQGAKIVATGATVKDWFSPGSFIKLTSAEALNRPAFDLLDAGVELVFNGAPAEIDAVTKTVQLRQIVVRYREEYDSDAPPVIRTPFDLSASSQLITAAGLPPALSDESPLVVAQRETWTASSGDRFDSATQAHQHARVWGGFALANADAATSVDLVGV
jgi:hypothetical protein